MSKKYFIEASGFYKKDNKVYELSGYSVKGNNRTAVLSEVVSTGRYYFTENRTFVLEQTFKMDYRRVRNHKG